MIIGSHVSFKAPDYFLGALKQSVSFGSNACMIYTGPPANAKRVPIEKFKIEQAREYLETCGILPEHVIVHAPYIINLANSAKPETAQFGQEFLSTELKRVESLGAKILVLHPGSHVNQGMDIGLEWIINGLNTVLDRDDTSVDVALETMAGKGSECGHTFEQLAYIREHIHKKDRIKICMDTCHVNDAGYDVQNVDGLLEEFDRILGLENLAVIHLNDSKNVRGARKDRHENIGKGTIGLETLVRICHHEKLKDVPKILETPYIDDKPPYKEEIELLKRTV